MNWLLWILACFWSQAQPPDPGVSPPVEAPSPVEASPPSESLLPADPRVEAELALARCQLAVQEKRTAPAVTECTRALELVPGLRRAFLWRAQALWTLERHEDAIADLESAVELLPDDAQVLRQLGAWQFERKNMVWAARNLHRALALAPGDARLRLLCAVAWMENREFEGAAELVEPLFSHPEGGISQQAHLIAGACALERGKRTIARGHLIRVTDGEPAGQARDLLARMTRSERGFKTGIAVQFHWGLGLDSNPAYAQDLGTSRPRVLALTLEQPLRLIWGITPALQVQGGIQYHYFVAPWDGDHHERVIAFSSLGADLAAAGKIFLPSWKNPANLELSATYQVLGLMGGEGMPSELDPFVFTERLSGTGLLSMQPGPGRELEYGLTGWYAAFRDSDRDGPGLMWFSRGSWFFRKDTLKWFVQSWFSGQQARWAAWSQLAGGFWSGLSTKLPDHFELAATLSFEGRWYPYSNREMKASGNSWNLKGDEDRIDWMGSAGLVLSHPMGKEKFWRWEIVLRNQWVHSDVDYFSFSRWVCMVQFAGDIRRK
ncbi:hypothetical protein KKD52_10970 [Myxococcota bacterium]|nr:hypothetical protein [Myxococcota bacterium]MBU1413071.1 hypothetical protein [Myxococcota bacterium]MBU1510873.1 hypothetical protein [Myxococcota bacterium]